MRYDVPHDQLLESAFCCTLGCTRSKPKGDAVYAVEFGPEYEDYTHVCLIHMAEVLDNLPDNRVLERVYEIAAPLTRDIDILFDGGPGPIAGRFIDAEVPEVGIRRHVGLSIGEWVELADDDLGYWALRIPVPAGWLVG